MSACWLLTSADKKSTWRSLTKSAAFCAMRSPFFRAFSTTPGSLVWILAAVSCVTSLNTPSLGVGRVSWKSSVGERGELEVKQWGRGWGGEFKMRGVE